MIVEPASIRGTAAWQRWNIARMFVRKTKSSSSGGMSRNDSYDIWYAALLTSTSSRPSSSMVRPTSERQCSRSPTSPAAVMQRRPASSTRRLVSAASSSSSRYEQSTSAPSRAKANATARPMPESAPVIRATRSVIRPRPTYVFSPWSASGRIACSRPGGSCSCSGNGGVGSACVGSRLVIHADYPSATCRDLRVDHRHGKRPRFQRKGRQAVRRAAQEGDEQGPGCCNRELRGLLQSRRQEVRVRLLEQEQREPGRHDATEEGRGP